MNITMLEGKRFSEMVIKGANHLTLNASVVDALNVFPVPDGDTGTNMNLSMTSGAKEVQKNIQTHIGKVASALGKGLLMGARGNSGVILSQLFRGFAKEIETKEYIDSKEFAKALDAGVKTAYKAVMKPVEGTILTVAKDAAKGALLASETYTDIIVVMEETLKAAKASLNRTPDLLPVLKEVGVVDSGGQGLVYVYEGFLAELKGQALPNEPDAVPSLEDLVNAEHHKHAQDFMDTSDIEFGYCTEFMVQLEQNKSQSMSFDEDEFRTQLSNYGDSLLVISDSDIVKVHIHSEKPGDVLSLGQQFGSLINMKIENMRQQHQSIVGETSNVLVNDQKTVSKEKVDVAIVAVAVGKGIVELFKQNGVQAVIEGGQSMNPSAEDFIEAVESVNAKHVFILPNNKNILLTANQAAELTEQPVTVLPTKSIPQGISSLLAFNPAISIDENKAAMQLAIDDVVSGQVTVAVRDTTIDGLEIKQGNYIGIEEGKIVTTSDELIDTTKLLLQHMVTEDAEIVTIIYGENVEEILLETLTTAFETLFPHIELDMQEGNQPIYPFIIAVE